jgi:hypothetical protein
MSKCPKCGGNAYVIDKRKYKVKMECLECRVTWLTDSRTCPKCKRPNGYAVDGICAQCFSKMKEAGHFGRNLARR